jgi:hypothetical protein
VDSKEKEDGTILQDYISTNSEPIHTALPNLVTLRFQRRGPASLPAGTTGYHRALQNIGLGEN